jgi:thioredoxin reductase (NADPH)
MAASTTADGRQARGLPGVAQEGATHRVDLLVIGGGPAGLYAAYYAGFRGLSVAVMDALPELGGQVSALYPEKQIYDIAGFPTVRGRDLIAGLMQQADLFAPRYLLGHAAQRLDHVDDRPVITSAQGARVECGAVVITGGIGTFTPRPLPAGTSYEGRGLAYFVPRPEEYAGKDVVVVGGGDSAFDWADTLESIAASVTLVHRRDRFRAHPASVERVLRSSVRVITNAEVVALHGERVLEAADVRDARTGEVQTLPAQGVVAALGFLANIGPLAEWGLELVNRKIVVDTTMATNLPRVFAAGDITEYPGKVRLIAVGFGESATAVNNAATVIDPAADVFPGHSTDAATDGPSAQSSAA